jgi:hypothetical protein
MEQMDLSLFSSAKPSTTTATYLRRARDTTLSFFSAASSVKDGKNSVLSMEAKNSSLFFY